MQYPNATALLVGMSLILLTGASLLHDKKEIKRFCSAFCVPLFLGLEVLASRGIIFILIFCFLVQFFLLCQRSNQEKECLLQKRDFFISLFSPFFCSLLIGVPFFWLSPKTTNTFEGFLFTTAFFILGICLCNQISKYRWKKIRVFFFVFTALFFFFSIKTEFFSIPLWNRFSLPGSISEWTSGRTDIYKDAWEMRKELGFLGGGGGVWESLYHAYQTKPYASAEVHSYLIQVWLDAGLPGLAAVISMGIFLIWKSIKYKKEPFLFSFSICGFFMLMHGAIDFDFSYFSILLLFFALLGIMWEKEKQKNFLGKSFGIGAAVIGIFLVLYNGNAMTARNLAIEANRLIQEGENGSDILKAVDLMERAAQKDRWNREYRMTEKKAGIVHFYSLADICTIAEDSLIWETQAQIQIRDEIKKIHQRAVEEALFLDGRNLVILEQVMDYDSQQ